MYDVSAPESDSRANVRDVGRVQGALLSAFAKAACCCHGADSTFRCRIGVEAGRHPDTALGRWSNLF